MKHKYIIPALFILIASTSFASPLPRKLLCQSGPLSEEIGIGNITSIQVEADGLSGNGLRNPVVTVHSEAYNGPRTEIGRRHSIEKDAHYNPRKYIGFDRYRLDQLIETEKFGPFDPADQCEIHFLLPAQTEGLSQFQAPMVIHCDQSGGSITLTCTLQ